MRRYPFWGLCAACATLHDIVAFRSTLSVRMPSLVRRLVKRDEGGATWDEEEWKDQAADKIRVPNTIVDLLEEEVGAFVTLCAIKTYKGYLKTFNDELTQKYLTRYGDDEITADGLQIKTLLKRPWVDYFETMIRTDSLEFKVLVRDINGRMIKGVRGMQFNTQLRDRDAPPPPREKKVRHYYIHKLEPRKVASALLTVREDVSAELLEDLRCVHLENEEVRPPEVATSAGRSNNPPSFHPYTCILDATAADQEVCGRLLGQRTGPRRSQPQDVAHGGAGRQLHTHARPHLQGGRGSSHMRRRLSSLSSPCSSASHACTHPYSASHLRRTLPTSPHAWPSLGWRRTAKQIEPLREVPEPSPSPGPRRSPTSSSPPYMPHAPICRTNLTLVHLA